MWDPQTDPLGINVTERARHHRDQYEAARRRENPFYDLYKPFKSYSHINVDGFQQAMREADAEKPRQRGRRQRVRVEEPQVPVSVRGLFGDLQQEFQDRFGGIGWLK